MLGVSGVTVVTTAGEHLYPFCLPGCGCIERPAFPAPSLSKGQRFRQTSRENTRRDRGLLYEIEFVEMATSAPQTYSSCPDLIRASINLRDNRFSKKMDHRVKPGDDELTWSEVAKSSRCA
jgi:hypothetical protein